MVRGLCWVVGAWSLVLVVVLVLVLVLVMVMVLVPVLSPQPSNRREGHSELRNSSGEK